MQIIIVNKFEKVIFNGPLYYEDNFQYIIKKIKENAYRENVTATEEDLFMLKIPNNFIFWNYGAKPFDDLKRKSLDEPFKSREIIYGFNQGKLEMKYASDFDMEEFKKIIMCD